MIKLILIIFIIQLIFFLLAFWQKTDKYTDISYAFTFVGIVTYEFISGEFSAYRFILMLLIFLWGIRLGSYLFIRILKIKKDQRFDGIREDVLKFAGFWVLQALTITVIVLPVLIVLIKDVPLSLTWFPILASILALKGLLLEMIADFQKFRFKSNPENEGKWVNIGLWRISRHPNYLGEIIFWIGIFLYTAPNLTGYEFLAVVSPFFIIYLLLYVSGIPILEKKYDKKFARNSNYLAYKANVGILLPKIFLTVK